MRSLLVLLFVTLSSLGVEAQKITWSEDIACLIYTHCTRCHNNTNSIAAIPFTNYKEAWSNRLAIKYYVENKLMPPFQPSTEKVRYMHEKTLTQKEIDLIVAWADHDFAQGDSTKAPPVPPIQSIPEITSPDLTYRTPAYQVPNIVGFQYHNFVVPTTFSIDKFIKQVEVVPSNLSAIYSVFVYSDTSSIPLLLDAADTSKGYEAYATAGSSSAKLLYGWVNGNKVYHTPNNMALKWEANSHLIMRFLYAEDALMKTDSTLLNIVFDSSGNTRAIHIAPWLHHSSALQNPPFYIPADSEKVFYEQYTIPTDITMIGISHWAQKICESMNCYAVTPLHDTIELLKIDDHEDLWSEGVYYFNKLIRLPAGSILYGEAHYNNTLFNPGNPFDPPRPFQAGMSDSAEQMIFSFTYTPYQVGDENIVADSFVHYQHYLGCQPEHTVTAVSNVSVSDLKVFPNPATQTLSIQLADEIPNLKIKLFNVLGELKKELTTQYAREVNLDVSELNPGIYFLQVRANDKNLTHKIIKQ